MPAVSPQLTRAVAFLYRTEEDARAGKKEGGSGFLAYVPWGDGSDRTHKYIVTNKHNIWRGGLAVRVSRLTGGFSVLTTKRDRWFEHSECDIAVYPIAGTPADWWGTAMGIQMFFTVSDLYNGLALPGDEVVLMSRFVGQDGVQRNTPVVHTGVISMLPSLEGNSPVMNESTGQNEEGFLIETHSHGGYSGSPVIGYVAPHGTTLGVDRTRFEPVEGRIHLLGMLWGHINLLEPIRGTDGTPTGEYVSMRSGLAGVVPAWDIAAILESSELTDLREETERMVNEEDEDTEPEVVTDFHEEQTDATPSS